MLLQEGEEGIDKPVSYYSKKFVSPKGIFDYRKGRPRPCLTVQHFEVYLSGSNDVVVYTDHNPLVFLEKFRNKSQKLFRWSLLLQPYPLKIVHIPGRDNVIADCVVE